MASEVSDLIGCFNSVMRELSPPRNSWQESPFVSILERSPATKGALGRRLVVDFFGSKGVSLEPAGRFTFATRNGCRCVVKLSLLWENGMYRFEQIRDREYERVVCLGLSPRTAHCWIVPKGIVLRNGTPQHGRETWWFACDPAAPPRWLTPYGGTLSSALGVLREAAHG